MTDSKALRNEPNRPISCKYSYKVASGSRAVIAKPLHDLIQASIFYPSYQLYPI
jgi:hypothetical protein